MPAFTPNVKFHERICFHMVEGATKYPVSMIPENKGIVMMQRAATRRYGSLCRTVMTGSLGLFRNRFRLPSILRLRKSNNSNIAPSGQNQPQKNRPSRVPKSGKIDRMIIHGRRAFVNICQATSLECSTDGCMYTSGSSPRPHWLPNNMIVPDAESKRKISRTGARKIKATKATCENRLNKCSLVMIV